MLQEIKEKINGIAKDKISFEPGIKVKLTDHSPLMWIDEVKKNKGIIMVKFSNQNNETCYKQMDKLADVELSGIAIRLHTMYK